MSVRRDLWGVRVFEDVGRVRGAWVVLALYRSRQKALERCRMLSDRREFPLVSPKICHPKQLVVDAYVLAGNRVH